jgi:hypothetical protein
VLLGEQRRASADPAEQRHRHGVRFARQGQHAAPVTLADTDIPVGGEHPQPLQTAPSDNPTALAMHPSRTRS